ncbi:MAG: 3-deoxy-7-phosphoheptulonate synthase, partial [Porcipelethomonas sp.]
MSMNFKRKLPVPEEIRELYPLSEEVLQTKAKRDKEIIDVFTGNSDKFLLIIGPCSADKEEPVMDYVGRLAVMQEKVKDKIIIIPRIYTNKPRTTGEGYKGMIHQPDPSKAEDILEGLIHVRHLHTRAIEDTKLTCADEMLYPENYRYLYDLLSYVAVGARSVEDQQHRLTASGMDIPVGMKNPTGGDLSVMLNSITGAQGS